MWSAGPVCCSSPGAIASTISVPLPYPLTIQMSFLTPRAPPRILQSTLYLYCCWRRLASLHVAPQEVSHHQQNQQGNCKVFPLLGRACCQCLHRHLPMVKRRHIAGVLMTPPKQLPRLVKYLALQCSSR
jgi:hypothetical protein